MVLWEITLGTAYFLGLKRTYRLGLKIQRRLISPKHPRIRQFARGRTRAAFDVALKVHQNIQQRDLQVGRSLGNWILRWLDRMKPSAQIRAITTEKNPSLGTSNTSTMKQLTNSSQQKTPEGFQRFSTSRFTESGRHLFTSSRDMLPKSFPTIAMMMRPVKPVGADIPHRFLSFSCPEASKLSPNRRATFEGVIRKDIMQWILQK